MTIHGPELAWQTKKGNGKVKVKEPMEMANKAITQLKEALVIAKS